MNKTIAIDGPAGSGKSSIAKLFSKSIGFLYLDTGSLYRSVSFYLKNKNIAHNNNEQIEKEFKNIKINFNSDGKILLNKEDITDQIRGDAISKIVVNYAQNSEIRNFIRILQKNFSAQKNIVIDGRDIGTIVFPDAFCKFYLDASVDIRAKRRYDELQKLNINEELKNIKEDIVRRDYLDRTRKESPLKIASDAIVIDTSEMSIDEVLSSMVSYYNKQIQLSSQESFMSDQKIEFLESLKEYEKPNDDPNQIIEGTVITATPQQIFVDVGAKEDAYIDHHEIDPNHTLKPHDKINVVKTGRTNLGIKVSKKKADQAKSYSQLQKIKNDKGMVSGKITSVVKAGFIVDIMSNNAFCPFSEYDIRKVDHRAQIGKEEDFVILEHDLNRLVISRKRIVEQRIKENREKFFNETSVGQTLTGKVVALLNYGIFVEIESGVDALIRNKDVSWKRFSHPQEVINYGDTVEIKIIELDEENLRIYGSIKELQQDPFDLFMMVHKVGDVLKGQVKKLQDYGAFVEIADGVSGLVKLSDLDWLKRVNHPGEVLKKNQEIEVKMIRIDKKSKQIDLGFKQTQPNPWDSMSKSYPLHTLIKSKIVSIVRNGLYTVIDDKIDGFIHIDDAKLNNQEKDFTKIYKEGDEVEVRILRINFSKQRLELGLYETSDDPWQDIATNYGDNNPIYGEVIEILENGVNVKINDEINAFCHITQISNREDDYKIEDEVKVGEQYGFFIQSINLDKKDVKLSRKDFLESKERKSHKSYLNNSQSQPKITISDLLK